MKKILLYFVSFLSPLTLLSQEGTRFYFMPKLGVEWGFSKLDNKRELPTYIRRAKLNPAAQYGISIMVDFDNKWGLEAGYSNRELGWGVFYKSKTDSALFVTKGSRALFTTVHSGYLHFFKPQTLIAIRKKRGSWLLRNAKTKRHYDYLAVFDLGFLGGISFEYIPPYLHIGSAGISFPGNVDDDIALSSTSAETINRFGGGIYFGIYSQFLNKGEKKLQLGIVYQQGILKRIVSNWSTSINGVEQPDFQTFTRGSHLAVSASFPIKFLPLGASKYKKLKD